MVDRYCTCPGCTRGRLEQISYIQDEMRRLQQQSESYYRQQYDQRYKPIYKYAHDMRDTRELYGTYEIYQEITKPIDSAKLITPPIKKVDTSKNNDYKSTRDTTASKDKDATTGDTDMLGERYVRQHSSEPRAKYRHLRAMIQLGWKIYETPIQHQFEIDAKFLQNFDAAAAWLIETYSDYQLNTIHSAVKRAYETGEIKTKGRPPNALNKDTIAKLKSGEDTTGQGIASDIPLVAPMAPIAQQVTQTTANVDLSAYAQIAWVRENFPMHSDLYNYVTRNALSDTAAALQSSFEGFVTEAVKKIEVNTPRVIEIKRNELPPITIGVQHRKFPLLLQYCIAYQRNGQRLCPWVYGPAGTGKSVAAEMVAKALSLEPYTMGTSLAKFDVLGFVNANRYETTPFRQAYEHGGVFCADEMDAWSQEAVIALNGALGNGRCAFPDGIVTRHKDFICIAAANTTGSGATVDYVARNKQDASSLDRFAFLHWPLDEVLEDSLIANKNWLSYVRQVRAKVASCGLNPKPLVTPRASIFGEALLAQGVEWDDVVAATLRKGLSETQWNMIKC